MSITTGQLESQKEANDAVSMTPNHLEGFTVARLDDFVAITTPIPDARGNVSTKTPVFHLPIYKVDLNLDKGDTSFHCDLADLTDLISKLKDLKNQWQRRV